MCPASVSARGSSRLIEPTQLSTINRCPMTPQRREMRGLPASGNPGPRSRSDSEITISVMIFNVMSGRGDGRSRRHTPVRPPSLAPDVVPLDVKLPRREGGW
ncbi:hypothetical protein GCM10017688_55540 [Streptomyces ramulosus]